MTTVILLIAGFKRPLLSMIGAGLLILTGLVTLSLLPQLGGLDAFIFKDIMVVAIGLTLLKRDLIRWEKASNSYSILRVYSRALEKAAL